MNPRLLTVLAALSLGMAAAQTTAPASPAPTTTVSLPGQIPASVSRSGADLLQGFLASGGKVQLLSAAGEVIGTVNADGTVALASGATLADARTVRLVPASGEAQSYVLARDLSKPGAIKLEVRHGERTLSLPLSAIANRQLPVQAPPAGTAPEEDGDGKGKPGKKEKEGRGKPANPGQGKNR